MLARYPLPQSARVKSPEAWLDLLSKSDGFALEAVAGLPDKTAHAAESSDR